MSIPKIEEIAYDLTYGIECRHCHRRRAKLYSTDYLGFYVQVTYHCKGCGQLSDILYWKKDYEKGKEYATK